MAPSPKKKNTDSIALNEAIQAVQGAADLIGSLMGDIRDNAGVSATLKAEVQVLKGEVTKIGGLLTDGSRPLQTRVIVLEKECETIKERLESIKVELETDAQKESSHLEAETGKRVVVCQGRFEKIEEKLSDLVKTLSLMQLDRDLQIASVKGRWKWYVALTAGVSSFLAVVVTLLVKYLS